MGADQVYKGEKYKSIVLDENNASLWHILIAPPVSVYAGKNDTYQYKIIPREKLNINNS